MALPSSFEPPTRSFPLLSLFLTAHYFFSLSARRHLRPQSTPPFFSTLDSVPFTSIASSVFPDALLPFPSFLVLPKQDDAPVFLIPNFSPPSLPLGGAPLRACFLRAELPAFSFWSRIERNDPDPLFLFPPPFFVVDDLRWIVPFADSEACPNCCPISLLPFLSKRAVRTHHRADSFFSLPSWLDFAAQGLSSSPVASSEAPKLAPPLLGVIFWSYRAGADVRSVVSQAPFFYFPLCITGFFVLPGEFIGRSVKVAFLPFPPLGWFPLSWRPRPACFLPP